MEQILKEAADLQSAQLQEVLLKLEPLLRELRQNRQKGELIPATFRIYQEALMLQLRTQAKLLLPETEIQSCLRDLMILNPKIDDSALNPREKILLERIRSGETGNLTLQTNPPQCSLIYLGMELGTTPIDVALIAGSYRFVLRKAGYRDQTFEAEIRSGVILTMDRSMRRSTVQIPLSVSPRESSVSFNGRQFGTGLGLEAFLESLPGDVKAQLGTEIRAWNTDPATTAYMLLPDVPIGETVSIELRAACYEPALIQLTVQDQEVDSSKPYLVHQQLRHVALKRTVGWVEVGSEPSGADVWIDGKQQGTTPYRQELCTGTHKIQIFHRSGQFSQNVAVPLGGTIKVNGIIKPALSFLGIYAQNASGSPLALLGAESESLAGKLASAGRAFNSTDSPIAALQSLRSRGELPIERLLDGGTGATETYNLIRGVASGMGRANLLLFGLKSGGKYLFRLYSTIHPLHDTIELPDLSDAAHDFLINQLNKADNVAARLKRPSIGLDLIDSRKGPVILRVLQPVAAEGRVLEVGAVILTIDQKPRSVREFELYLHSLPPGQTVTLELAPRKETRVMVPLPVRFDGAEYPWSMPDGCPNAVLTILQHLTEKEPLSEEAKFARLSLARGLMARSDWKLALEFLAGANLEPHKTGICPGTVLFYQGRCYEELGDMAAAERYYTRAREYPNATIGTASGMILSTLAEHRMQRMKRTAP